MPSLKVGEFRASADYRDHKFSSMAIDGIVWNYKFTKSRRDLFYAVGPLKNSVDLGTAKLTFIIRRFSHLNRR